VLTVAISLGFNVYHYLSTVNSQATINNMRSLMILAWGWQMRSVASYLRNVSTNIDAAGVAHLLGTASIIGASTENRGVDLYVYLRTTPQTVDTNLFPYYEGAPAQVRRINSTAVGMIKNLAQRISDTADWITGEHEDLTKEEGVDPIQLLKRKDILDNIINECIEIINLSEQIHNFNPKFQ